jgi:hypothetical protein
MGGNIEGEGFDIPSDILEVGLTDALRIRCALASSSDIREKAGTGLESVQPERLLTHGDAVCSRRFSASGVSIWWGEPIRGRGEDIIFMRCLDKAEFTVMSPATVFEIEPVVHDSDSVVLASLEVRCW